MDAAYRLKMKIDQNEPIEDPMIYLEQSQIVKKYEQQENLSALGKIFALVGLAEIPYASQLPVTQSLIQYVEKNDCDVRRFFLYRKSRRYRSLLQCNVTGSLCSSRFRAKTFCTASTHVDQKLSAL